MDRVGPFNTSNDTVPYGSLAGWQNANPAADVEGSVPSVEAWIHAIEEIVYCIEQSGQVPDHTNLHQLFQAIRTLSGGFINEVTTLTKVAKQQFQGAMIEMDVTWPAPAANPSWGTLDPTGTFFTVTTKCRLLSLLLLTQAISCSAAGYAEGDAHIAVDGTDVDAESDHDWPSSNTTVIPYIRMVTELDLNVGDTVRVRGVATATNFNGAFVLGNDGTYGITSQSSRWKLWRVS